LLAEDDAEKDLLAEDDAEKDLLAEDDAEQDLLAEDVGIAGGAASAEEAAVHRIPDEDDYPL
ncbi:DUF5709 domain-containing protein, partial [Streptomyces avermitilis]|uniref:DUF5709 domain-containing protein n=1 Tax=Streptomyces avermitilis TaxID=33903 RepID=UPI0033A129F3